MSTAIIPFAGGFTAVVVFFSGFAQSLIDISKQSVNHSNSERDTDRDCYLVIALLITWKTISHTAPTFQSLLPLCATTTSFGFSGGASISSA